MDTVRELMGAGRRHPTLRAIAAGEDVVPELRDRRDAPLRRWVRRAVVGDLASAAVAVCLAGFLRFGLGFTAGVTGGYLAFGVIVALGWPLLGALCGSYELRTSLHGVEELRRVLRAGLCLAAAIGMGHFLLKLGLSRGYVGILIPLVVALTATSRFVLRSRTDRWMARGYNHHKAVAVGSAAEVAHLCEQLAQGRQSPIDVIAYVIDDLDVDDEVPAPLQHLLRLPSCDAISVLPDHGIAVDLLVRAGRPEAHEMVTLSQRAHDLGVGLATAPHRHVEANLAVSYVPLGSTPLLMVETPTLRPAAAFVKSCLDRAMGLAAIALLSPILLGLALVIAVCEGRGVLFRQERVGRDGKTFTCFKFRTMQHDAEAQLITLIDLNEGSGPLFKLKADPRVTGTGHWLRRFSLDELPQLFNVVRGHMSIVGPRPALPSEVATFDQRTARRLLVKPGITGLWQVEGRSDLPWDEGVYLDLMYVDHWSPLLDCVIIARTIKTVIRPSGAY